MLVKLHANMIHLISYDYSLLTLKYQQQSVDFSSVIDTSFEELFFDV